MPKHKTKGPLSIQGGPPVVPKHAPKGDDGTLHLHAVARPPEEDFSCLPAAINFLGDATLAELLQQGSTSASLQLDPHSDCVLACSHDPGLQPDCILVNEAQRHNLRMAEGELYAFRLFELPENEPVELVDLEAEVRLWGGSGEGDASVRVDAQRLAALLLRQCFGRVVALNEVLLLELEGVQLVLRITATNTLAPEEQEEAIGYHCFRGRLAPETQVYLHALSSTSSASSGGTNGVAAAQQLLASLDLSASSGNPSPNAAPLPAAGTAAQFVQSRAAAAGPPLELVGARSRALQRPPTNKVNIITSDGEWFPVAKKLLRPCIALTKVVRDSGDTCPEVTVDVDTLTFDRCLLFLEAEALGTPPPGFALHLLDDLLQAAQELGCRPLQDWCEHRLGNRAASLACYSFADVQRANAAGKCWLLLDGMVLDVGRWLPEHPGGATIIPRQSLDVDCSRFFEMYHASRESFLYLKEFYIGELAPAERPAVPLGGGQAPSADFLRQLREFTLFRMSEAAVAAASASIGSFKSF